MTREEFTQLAQSYGSDIGRWPAELQASATMLAKTPEGRKALEGEAALDALLRQYVPPAPQDALMTHILRLPESVAQDARRDNAVLLLLFRPSWAKALMLISYAVMGYAVGMLPAESGDTSLAARQANRSTISVDSVIMGPQTLKEIIL